MPPHDISGVKWLEMSNSVYRCKPDKTIGIHIEPYRTQALPNPTLPTIAGKVSSDLFLHSRVPQPFSGVASDELYCEREVPTGVLRV